MNLVIFLLLSLVSALSSASAELVSEFRIKVGSVLEKLTFPETVKEIHNLGEETMINTAIDFEKTFKPKFIQLALIPKEKSGKLASAITFDMEYKDASSKATLNINLKKLKPGMINLGSEYALKVFISGGPQSKDRLDWLIGNLVMPKSIEYKIPEIEDQFYKMPEIYTPEEQKAEGKQNPIYPVAGIVASVLLPWICFIKMWKNSGSNFSIPSFLFDNSKSRAFPFFSLSLMCLFVLIISSWVFFNIFQTLGFLAFFSSIAFISGHCAFKAVVNEKSIGDEKKSD